MDPILTAIARVCHEANRAYCISIGDLSQERWEYAPQWQRDSALSGVQAIANGVVQTPRDSHDRWLEEKRRDGWRYGSVKDPEAKTHPAFLPYEELPKEQRVKDDLFYAIASTLLRGMRP